MPLPASGPISLSQVNVELGLSATAQISLNDAAVRTLFGRASGANSMSDGYGKANQFAFTIASNQTNANLRTLAVNAGWNQTTKVVATIASGIYISSNSTGTPALTVNGSFPGGVELVNNGFIVGRGGNGGGAGGSGASGGLALSVSSAVTLNNAGTIAGGGGGGGGGGGRSWFDGDFGTSFAGGGGGGGGRSSAAANSSGGGGGGAGTGYMSVQRNAASGGAGTVSSAGGGGVGGILLTNGWEYLYGGSGGSGGGWGASGAGGGVSSGARDNAYNPGGGGSAGAAITGNSNITYVATGTRLGAIS